MITRPLAMLCALPLLAAFGAPVQAQTVVVNIDATTTGCVQLLNCMGSPHLQPGQYVGELLNPVQLTLGPGTYTITNATGMAGANPAFTAWRYNSGDHWIWSFEMIDDATKTMLVQGCCSAVYDSQAQAAADPFAVGYSSFTLTQTTTLSFITEDYAPGDNAGGIALAITAVPEPAAPLLMLGGLLGLAARRGLGRVGRSR